MTWIVYSDEFSIVDNNNLCPLFKYIPQYHEHAAENWDHNFKITLGVADAKQRARREDEPVEFLSVS